MAPRCKYFDDSGNPRRPHPEVGQCRFAHPGSADWDSAGRSWADRNTEFARDAWTAEPRPNNNPRDTRQTWAPPAKQDSGYNAKPADGERRQAPAKEPPAPAAASGSSWADLLDDTPTYGWGSSTTSAWGNGDTSSKATTDPRKKSGPTESGSHFGKTWNAQPTETQGWSRQDVEMQEAEPYKLASTSSQTQAPSKATKPDLPALNVQVGIGGVPSFAPGTAGLSKADGKSRLTPTSPPTIPTNFPHDQEDDDFNFFPSTTSATSMKNYRGDTGRVKLFNEVVSNMQEAIMYQIILTHAQAEESRWRKTQTSELYSHLTPKARSILDLHRARYKKNVSDAKTGRDKAFKGLAELPEFSSQREQIMGHQETREKIKSYTTELKEWFSELQLHKRILLADDDTGKGKAKAKPAQPPGVEESLRILFESSTWTWAEVREAMLLLEQLIQDNSELLYTPAFTRSYDFDGPQISVTLDERLDVPVALPVPNDFGDRLNEMSNQFNAFSTKITDGAGLEAGLFTSILELSGEVEELRNTTLQIDNFCEQAETHLAEFERRLRADDSDIGNLTQQIQNLHLHKRPKAQEPLAPTKIEDHLEYIRPFVFQRIREDLTRVFENLLARARDNQNTMVKEVENMFRPLFVLTDQIRQVATEGSADTTAGTSAQANGAPQNG